MNWIGSDGVEFGYDGCSERIDEIGFGSATDEPDGDATVNGSLPVHHGLCLLESWKASRPIRVSSLFIIIFIEINFGTKLLHLVRVKVFEFVISSDALFSVWYF